MPKQRTSGSSRSRKYIENHYVNGLPQGELFPPKMRKATRSNPELIRIAQREEHAKAVNKAPLRQRVMEKLMLKTREREHARNLARLEAERREHTLQVTRVKEEFLTQFETRVGTHAEHGNLTPFVRLTQSEIKRLDREINVLERQPNEHEVMERRQLEREALQDLLKDLRSHMRTR